MGSVVTGRYILSKVEHNQLGLPSSPATFCGAVGADATWLSVGKVPVVGAPAVGSAIVWSVESAMGT